MRDVKKTHGPVELAQGTSRPFSPSPRVSVFGGHPRALARLVSLAPSLDVPVPTFGFRHRPNTRAEAGLTNEEASEVMKVVRFGVDGAALAGAKSASEMLREEAEKLPIYTFCQELDDLLGGGVAVGEITELCGCPGIGKTQMCIQLCASTQIPCPSGSGRRRRVRGHRGVVSRRSARRTSPRGDGEAPGRIARANPEDQHMADAMASFTPERVLDRIHLFRCHEVTELLAVLETLPAYCKATRRAVVVDSVAFHFRQDFRDMALRTAILAKMTNRLMALATDQALAVVTVNQVTVKPGAETGGGGARLVPALGESYAHACATRDPELGGGHARGVPVQVAAAAAGARAVHRDAGRGAGRAGNETTERSDGMTRVVRGPQRIHHFFRKDSRDYRRARRRNQYLYLVE